MHFFSNKIQVFCLGVLDNQNSVLSRMNFWFSFAVLGFHFNFIFEILPFISNFSFLAISIFLELSLAQIVFFFLRDKNFCSNL